MGENKKLGEEQLEQAADRLTHRCDENGQYIRGHV